MMYFLNGSLGFPELLCMKFPRFDLQLGKRRRTRFLLRNKLDALNSSMPPLYSKTFDGSSPAAAPTEVEVRTVTSFLFAVVSAKRGASLAKAEFEATVLDNDWVAVDADATSKRAPFVSDSKLMFAFYSRARTEAPESITSLPADRT